VKDIRLPHYFSVVKGEALPKFHLSKNVLVELPGNHPVLTPSFVELSDNDLWETHNDGLNRFHQEGHTNADGKEFTLLDVKIELGKRMLRNCMICETRCGTNRIAGEAGVCGVLEPRISSEFIHMGEETELIPSHTVFFSGCNFTCVFCQNWEISQNPSSGVHNTPEQVARMMENKKANNTNWVGGDPIPNLPFILQALGETSLKRAQVWNSNMYLTEKAMSLLDGVIDLFLTDFKYGNNRCGEDLSGVPGYFDVVSRNHGLIRGKDTIIRHLVLPGHVECCTRPILEWIAKNTPNAVVNVMAQYHSDYKAYNYSGLNRRLSGEEYRDARRIARELGLKLTC